MPVELRDYWAAFLAQVPSADPRRFYDVCQFGDEDDMVNELAALVLQGRKRATAGSVWAYEHAGVRLPQPGDLSVVLDAARAPVCVMETLQVEVVRFGDVTEEFAAAEGEGDGSLAYWREAHRAFFGRECQRIGREFSEDLPVACERFRVVFPVGVGGAGA